MALPEIQASIFILLTCSLFPSMPDDLDDDFVPDFDDSFVIELEQPALPAVTLKKRKRREKEQQSKVHSLFFIFFSRLPSARKKESSQRPLGQFWTLSLITVLCNLQAISRRCKPRPFPIIRL